MRQCEEALALANELRYKAASQRRELCTLAPAQLLTALIEPPAEFARCYKLRSLFCTCPHRGGLVRQFGPRGLDRTLNLLNEKFPLGRNWTCELRLSDLNPAERHRFAAALLQKAPPSWRGAA